MFEVLTATFANLLTRFLPFIFLKKYAKKFIFLKDEFPVVLLSILTLYILFPHDIDWNLLKYKLIAIATTIIIHLYFRRFLLSIFIGSFVYIFLVNR